MATAPRFNPGGNGVPRTRILTPARSFVRPLKAQDSTYYLSGITRDSNGVALAYCIVYLFDTATQVLQQSCVSTDAGLFAFKNLDSTKTYFVVAQKHAGTLYTTLVVADGATHWWRFNEPSGLVFADSIGSNNVTPAASTGLTYGVASGPLNSLGIGVAGAVANAPLSSSFASGSTYTIEAWVKPRSGTVGGRGLILGQRNFLSAIPDGFTVYMQGDEDKRVGWYDWNWGDVRGSTPLLTGVIYHIAGVMSAGSLALYVNGVAQTLTGTSTGLQASITIDGCFNASNDINAPLDVQCLSDVAFYPSALSAATLLNHYNNRLSLTSAAYCGVTLDTLAGSVVLD